MTRFTRCKLEKAWNKTREMAVKKMIVIMMMRIIKKIMKSRSYLRVLPVSSILLQELINYFEICKH